MLAVLSFGDPGVVNWKNGRNGAGQQALHLDDPRVVKKRALRKGNKGLVERERMKGTNIYKG